MTSAQCATRSPTISSPRRTRHSCSSTTSPPNWPRSARWITRSCAVTAAALGGVPTAEITINGVAILMNGGPGN